MNNDLISRSELKKALDTIKQIGYDTENKPLFDYVELPDLIKVIDNAPTVDLEKTSFMKGYNYGCDDGKRFYERPQGEWINHKNSYGHNIADCSICGKAMQWHDEDEDGVPRYCWYCGAKIRGVKE